MTFSLAQGANSLLFNLVMELRGGNIRRCEALGLKPEEMRLLRSLTIGRTALSVRQPCFCFKCSNTS